MTWQAKGERQITQPKAACAEGREKEEKKERKQKEKKKKKKVHVAPSWRKL